MRALCVRAGARVVLEGVGFDVAAGEVLGVLGQNGAGKTTMLEAVAGLRVDVTGSVAITGRRLVTFRERAAHLAFLPDGDLLPEETTLGVALGLSVDSPLVRAFELTTLLDARASEVSRGEARRAQLCAALSLGRRVALLDEPFGTFDPRQLRALLPVFRDAVRETAVVVTLHQMRTAEQVADRLLLLCDGRVLALGTLDELRARAGVPGGSLDDVFLRLLEEEGPRAGA